MNADVEVLQAQVRNLRQQLDRLQEWADSQIGEQVEPEASQQDQDEPGELLYPSAAAWVEGWFAEVATRQLGSQWRWCAWWWNHAEAVGRLTLLWQGWEAARISPEALPGWWTMFDHHVTRLFDSTCTFASCNEHECNALKPLRTVPKPPEPAPGDD